MVKAIVNISEEANRVINIVKAKHGLKDKSEALNFIVSEFEEDILEPQFRPEFLESLKEARHEKFRKVKNFKDIFEK